MIKVKLIVNSFPVLLVFTLYILCASALASQDDGVVNIGRDDPFGNLMVEKSEPKQLPDIVSQPLAVEEKAPQLYVENVVLKTIDASSLKSTIEKMSSKYGSVSSDNKNNSLVICDTKENLARILEQIQIADKTQDQVLFVETVTLKFLKAENLKEALSSMSSQYGSMSTDEKTNSVIVCDTKDRVEKIVAEIRKADQTPQQIMIEVVILDVQLSDDTEIGVNWDNLLGNSTANAAMQEYTKNFKQTLVSDLGFGGTSGAGFGLMTGGISATIHALREKQNVEILASPRIMVVSGGTAEIKTVEEIPYQEQSSTSEGGSLTSTEFKEVGVTLTVKAVLIDNDKILMTIEPEQSVNSGTSGISNIPIVDTRQAKTTLLMEDGQIIVMGGLRKKETTINAKKV
ncbi:MAG: hypothetical protein H8D47_02585, partial [Planctomycetes bacterium]|nr:hypothetical protein [Planctomycetota bacterium]